MTDDFKKARDEYLNKVLHYTNRSFVKAGCNWAYEWLIDNLLCPELDKQAALSYALGKGCKLEALTKEAEALASALDDLYETAKMDVGLDDFQVNQNDGSAIGDAKKSLTRWRKFKGEG